MREQSNKLVESLPQLAGLLEAADSVGSAVWFVWQCKVSALSELSAEAIAEGRLKSVRPRNNEGEFVGSAQANEFSSRTAALRMSERHCRFAREARSEKGHWGVWAWKNKAGESVFQGVFPVLKPKPEPEPEQSEGAPEAPAAE